MGKLEIKRLAPDKVRPYSGNARTHSQEAGSADRGFDQTLRLSITRSLCRTPTKSLLVAAGLPLQNCSDWTSFLSSF
jgi:hypothetical protein